MPLHLSEKMERRTMREAAMVMTAQRTDLVVAVAVEVGGGGGGAGAGCGGGGVGAAGGAGAVDGGDGCWWC